jgi:hypothetical protein
MIRLIGALLVSGFVACGLHAAMAGNWGNTHGFMWGGLGASVIFTLTWVISTYYMDDMLKNKGKTRDDITKKHIVGMSIAVLALGSTLGFVAAGIGAAWAQQWVDAHWFLWGGNIAGFGLSLAWCISDYKFVENNK